MSSDFDGLDIVPAPCSRYEQFVNLYSNINKINQDESVPRQPNLQSRGSNVESQKSKFRSVM